MTNVPAIVYSKLRTTLVDAIMSGMTPDDWFRHVKHLADDETTNVSMDIIKNVYLDHARQN